MKYSKILSALIVYLTLLMISILSSCDDKYLQEVPKGFLSPENTFTTKEGFESGIADLYRVSRAFKATTSLPGMSSIEHAKSLTILDAVGTDLGWYWDKKNIFGDYTLINSFNDDAQNNWIRGFYLVKGANVILTRSNDKSIGWENENDKLQIQAEASFFRAFAYRYLVYLFGDVPIIKEEITAPKLDFVRSPKDSILKFMIKDLEFATQYLPVTNSKDGKLSKAAADQLLAETYISTGQYDKSIEASSRIINDPQYHLMTTRFGSMTDKPGDVFRDLFSMHNQNDPANTEVIWAWQSEYNTLDVTAFQLERSWGPALAMLKTPDRKVAILIDEFLGQPIGFIRPSVYLEYTIWSGNWNNDIRNSPYNMKRQFIINNPASTYYGQVYIPKATDTVRYHFVYIQKVTQPYGHVQGYDQLGRIYIDQYVMRLAETYLLRAEAYLDKGDLTSAAADINVVRNRANATPVDPANVNIDYILDERARELVVEEPRRLTLARLGLLYERVKKYNPISAPTIQQFNNLMPIPQTEIDANVGAKLTQNPGY